MIGRLLPLLLLFGLGGCEPGSEPVPAPTAPAPPPEAPPPPLPTEPPPAPATSYELQASSLLTDWGALLGHCAANAVAYGDFDSDGDEDAFVAQVSHRMGSLSTDPAPVTMFLNEGEAGFRLSDEVFAGRVPQLVHPRKAIPGDFNGDGQLDVFVAGHGYDKPPFPGESPVLILSTERGLQEAPGLERHVGFFHGAASGDVDYDGDLDIVVANNFAPGTFLLLNGGDGSFAFDQSRLPAELGAQLIFTAEIVDVDRDLWPDLVLAGHEYDGWPTTIYWGDPSGTFEDSRKTVLPAVEGQGIVVDMDAEDLDGDGHREVILNRTMNEPFYKGFYIQIVAGRGGREFADETEQRIVGGSTPDHRWLDWLRLIDLNGDGALDLFADDCEDHGLQWLNDGSGLLWPGP